MIDFALGWLITTFVLSIIFQPEVCIVLGGAAAVGSLAGTGVLAAAIKDKNLHKYHCLVDKHNKHCPEGFWGKNCKHQMMCTKKVDYKDAKGYWEKDVSALRRKILLLKDRQKAARQDLKTRQKEEIQALGKKEEKERIEREMGRLGNEVSENDLERTQDNQRKEMKFRHMQEFREQKAKQKERLAGLDKQMEELAENKKKQKHTRDESGLVWEWQGEWKTLLVPVSTAFDPNRVHDLKLAKVPSVNDTNAVFEYGSGLSTEGTMTNFGECTATGVMGGNFSLSVDGKDVDGVWLSVHPTASPDMQAKFVNLLDGIEDSQGVPSKKWREEVVAWLKS